MEREPPEVGLRLMRACRSLNYNRELQPLVEERIERAEGRLRGYMLAQGLRAVHLGAFQVEMNEEGDIELTRLRTDGWRQMPLPEKADDGQPVMNAERGGTLTVSGVANGRPGHREQEVGRGAERHT